MCNENEERRIIGQQQLPHIRMSKIFYPLEEMRFDDQHEKYKMRTSQFEKWEEKMRNNSVR